MQHLRDLLQVDIAGDPALAGLVDKFSLGSRTTHKIKSELGGMWPGKPLRTLLALPRGKPSYKQHQPQLAPRATVAAHTDPDGENMGERVLPSTVAVVAGERLVWVDVDSIGGWVTNAVMSRVAFSPTFIWVTPSSQPKHTWDQRRQREKHEPVNGQEKFTLDDLTNTNLGVEVTTADRGVEPGGRVSESAWFPGRAGLDVTPRGGDANAVARGRLSRYAYFLPLLSCNVREVMKKSAIITVFLRRSLRYKKPGGQGLGGRV